MGRTLKRVPLDFSWPMNETWSGYINPFWSQHVNCAPCDGRGLAPDAKRISDEWYGNAPFFPASYGATPLSIEHPALRDLAERHCINAPHYYGDGRTAVTREIRRLWELFRYQWCHHLIQADVDALLEANRLWDFTRVPRNDEQRAIVRAKVDAGGNSWLPESSGYRPTADEVNSWSLYGFGHDACNAFICLEARCKREGVEMMCSACGGHGHTFPPGVREQYDAWTESEPPTGEGFQLWETTSEGSPISPVFATLEALCEFAARNCTTFASNHATAMAWREMLEGDFVHHAEGSNIFI